MEVIQELYQASIHYVHLYRYVIIESYLNWLFIYIHENLII